MRGLCERLGVPAGFEFPFLFGGTFIEGRFKLGLACLSLHFPSFSEGLSLRDFYFAHRRVSDHISLPFRRDFH